MRCFFLHFSCCYDGGLSVWWLYRSIIGGEWRRGQARGLYHVGCVQESFRTRISVDQETRLFTYGLTTENGWNQQAISPIDGPETFVTLHQSCATGNGIPVVNHQMR